jgi:hypothetical protein
MSAHGEIRAQSTTKGGLERLTQAVVRCAALAEGLSLVFDD